jgi:putative glycosyltransferase (TIGR04372 family)
MTRGITYIPIKDPLALGLARANAGEIGYGPANWFVYDETYLPYRFWQFLKAGGSIKPMALDDDLRRAGETAAERTGIRLDRPIVLLHVRQNSRSQRQRDADISGYGEVIRMLLERDYAVVRIGDAAMPPCPVKHPFLADLPYSSNYDPILDVALAERCEFMIITAAGVGSSAWMFGKPMLALNNTHHYNRTPTALEMSAFQVYQEAASGRELPLAEIMERRLYDCQADDDFARAGISARPIAPEQLAAVLEEFLDVLANGYDYANPANRAFKRFTRAAHDRAQAGEPGPGRTPVPLSPMVQLGRPGPYCHFPIASAGHALVVG